MEYSAMCLGGPGAGQTYESGQPFLSLVKPPPRIAVTADPAAILGSAMMETAVYRYEECMFEGHTRAFWVEITVPAGDMFAKIFDTLCAGYAMGAQLVRELHHDPRTYLKHLDEAHKE